MRSSAEVSEAWCLVTAREGLVPSTAASLYASTARMRTWRLSLTNVIWWTCLTGLDGEFYYGVEDQYSPLADPAAPLG